MQAFDQVLPVLTRARAKAGDGVGFSAGAFAARQAALRPAIVD